MPESESTGGMKAAPEAGSLPKQVYKDILLEVAVANMWVPLMSGAVATGYLLLLGASEFEFGLLVSIGSLAGISAPIFSYLVDRYGDKKKLTLLCSLPVRLIQFILAALPLLMYYKILPKPLLLYLVVSVAMSFVNVFNGQAWFSWLGDIIPEKQRGHYFARRNVMGGAVGMVFGVLGGLFLDGYSNKHLAFTGLFFFGSIFALLDYYYLRRLPAAPIQPPAKEPFSLEAIPKKMLEVSKDKNFTKLVWFNSAWTFGMTLIGTYQNMYLIKELKMSYTLINIYGIVSIVMGLVTMTFWGRIADRYGNKPVMLITGNILSVTPFLWAFMAYANWLLAVIYFVAGACWSGFNLSSYNMMLKIAPREKRASYMAFNTIAVAAAATIAPAAGGAILSGLGSYKLDLYFFKFGNYQMLFVLGVLGRFFPSLFLRQFKETGEGDVNSVALLVRTEVAEVINSALSFALVPFSFIGNVVEDVVPPGIKKRIWKTKKK